MDLIKGRKYTYWNKSVYEKSASKKKCILLQVSKDGKRAVIERLDLDVNRIQIVDIKRLKEIEIIQKELF